MKEEGGAIYLSFSQTNIPSWYWSLHDLVFSHLIKLRY